MPWSALPLSRVTIDPIQAPGSEAVEAVETPPATSAARAAFKGSYAAVLVEPRGLLNLAASVSASALQQVDPVAESVRCLWCCGHVLASDLVRTMHCMLPVLVCRLVVILSIVDVLHV